ncbi:hypothetical protein [Bradyrhizobium sp. LHD-71]|uniref:hypothetical protein n=1 Tax=Bradyrhizobium sp. LHD-71 TaxID=3072141 RepID=UPI00280C89FC|nr:hypothetical protein [Bradyrhizobium sp. LHD-71]MDQ8729400.1 hypothetical protein [Bradyrhizobium sp. LHD-71]
MANEISFGPLRYERQRGLDGAFFLGVPAALAVTMSVVGGYMNTLGAFGGLLYVAGLSFMPWWMAGLATAVAHVGLRRFRLPLWALTVIGASAASLLLIPITHELNGWFRTHWPGGLLLHEMSWPVTLDRVREIAISAGRATALWTAFCYVFATTLGWSRYQYDPEADRASGPVVDTPPSRFENSGRNWTKEADLQLARYVADGLPPGEIARHMHRTVAAVRIRIAKINAAARRKRD